MTGPCVTPGSMPSPSRSLPTCSTSAATNSSWTRSCTNTLLVQMQVWPAFLCEDMTTSLAARRTSASSKTMYGALPPSSSEMCFIVSAEAAYRSFPTRVDPVNEILRTVLDAVIALPIASASPDTTFRTPLGMPARSPRCARASAVSGVSSLGFKTTVHPAARAGATLRVGIENGKFHGLMAPTTPGEGGRVGGRVDGRVGE